MANDEHIAKLKEGVAAWNAWREENPNIHPDLSGADLSGVDLSGKDHEKLIYAAEIRRFERVEVAKAANLRGADLSDAHLSRANLSGADLTEAKLNVALLCEAILFGADLSRANLCGARLARADLCRADLSGADLTEAKLNVALLCEAILFEATLVGADLSRAHLGGANLNGANLSGANLSEAGLEFAQLVETDLTGANLTDCRVYGASAWNLKLERATQQNLVITPSYRLQGEPEPAIAVDNIEVAQFIYLMLNNQKVRDVIDTITSKVVLILGRFTAERRAVLDGLRDELRKRNYLPILFDFEVPARRNITETVTLLARMARFIIADLTDPSSIPQELQAIIPSVHVPVQPLLLEGSPLYSMFEDFEVYPWVLRAYQYKKLEQLLATLAENVIAPAEAKVKELTKPR
jgi:uncharacterized protein YjbI with pentapeptide repeats